MFKGISLSLSIVVVSGLSGQAQAACPTVNDIAHGIFVTYDDESYSRISPYSSDAMFEDVHYMDQSGYRIAYVMQGGVAATKSFDFENAQVSPVSVIETKYTGGDLDVDGLASGSSIFLDFERTSRDGTASGSLLVEKSDQVNIDLGGCSYDSHPITLTKTTNSGKTVTRLYYIGELGVSVYRQIVDPEGRFADYNVVKISNDFPWLGRD